MESLPNYYSSLTLLLLLVVVLVRLRCIHENVYFETEWYNGVNISWQLLNLRLPTTFISIVTKQTKCDEHLKKSERFLNEFIQIRLNE